MADDTGLGSAAQRLHADGRWDWLVDSDKRAWSIRELVDAYNRAIGVPLKHDIVYRWYKELELEGGAENYGGKLGYWARRDALIRFFAEGRQLKAYLED